VFESDFGVRFRRESSNILPSLLSKGCARDRDSEKSLYLQVEKSEWVRKLLFSAFEALDWNSGILEKHAT